MSMMPISVYFSPFLSPTTQMYKTHTCTVPWIDWHMTKQNLFSLTLLHNQNRLGEIVVESFSESHSEVEYNKRIVLIFNK